MILLEQQMCICTLLFEHTVQIGVGNQGYLFCMVETSSRKYVPELSYTVNITIVYFHITN
jgi:hypothetical protein